jgi:hypothetical protein
MLKFWRNLRRSGISCILPLQDLCFNIVSSLFTFMPFMCMVGIVLHLGMGSPLSSSALVIVHD